MVGGLLGGGWATFLCLLQLHTEWPFRHMLRVLHSVIPEQTITTTLATNADL